MDESIQQQLAAADIPVRGYWCWQHVWPDGHRSWCDICERERPATPQQCASGHYFKGSPRFRHD